MTDNLKINQTLVRLIKDDLTALDVEAFVFYAREDLQLGSGYGNAISMRGGPAVKAELDKMSKAELTQSVITSAGGLNAKKIIHSVGPKFQEKETEKKLAATMDNALKCAMDNRVEQLAFPFMGVGFYGVPIDMCVKVMLESIKKHCSNKTALKEIIICAKDTRELKPFSDKLSEIKGGK